MSLTPKRKMTEKNLAAHRSNGPKSRGAVTPEGRARAAAANLRHGLYSKAQKQVLIALGEDPREYARLMNSLEDNLTEGLERELVARIGRALWRMRRAERIQDGLAAKRVQKGTRLEDLVLGPRLVRCQETYERLAALGKELKSPDFTPSASDIQSFESGFGDTPSDEIQKLFPLLRSYAKAAAKVPRSAGENSGVEPNSVSAGERERESARKALDDEVLEAMIHYGRTLELVMAESNKTRSPENMAAMMAPREESSLLMQRMEESSLRQLYRLTNVLIKVRKGALTKKDVKNEGCSGNVYENKGADDKMPSD